MRQKGFGILETIIALAVVNVGILASLNLLTTSINNWQFTKQQVVDTARVQALTEEVRNWRDADPANWRLTITLPPGVSITGSDPYLITTKVGTVTIVTHLYDWRPPTP